MDIKNDNNGTLWITLCSTIQQLEDQTNFLTMQLKLKETDTHKIENLNSLIFIKEIKLIIYLNFLKMKSTGSKDSIAEFYQKI